MVAEGESVEAAKGGEVGVELAESFAELTLGAEAILALVMVEADGKVDQGLQKEPLGAAGGGPDFFEHLVALEELAAVEQVEAVVEKLGAFWAHATIYSSGRAALPRTMIWDRLWGKPAPGAAPLRGAAAVRREKSYSAQTGYVYLYYYEGYREGDRDGRRGKEHVFHVSSDRKTSFPLTVFLARAVVEGWESRRGRTLSPTEQYAAVKLTLFQAFDDRAELGAATADVEVDAGGMAAHLETLGID